MSQLDVDTVQAKTTNGDLTLQGNGTGVVKFGGGALALPDADGTADQLLKTDGAGALSFTDAPSGGLQSAQVFTSSETWTKPAGINFVKVTIVGGGGGGGAADTLNVCGAGGYGGSASIKYIDVSAISSETVTIGAAGAGGVAGSNNGSAGGTTSFGAHCTAPGGPGGPYGTLATVSQPAPTTGTGGDVNISGQPGFPNIVSGGAPNIAGGGGHSILGGGATYHPWGQADHARTAAGIGGGGQGGGNGSAADEGGAGGAGICIVEEYA